MSVREPSARGVAAAGHPATAAAACEVLADGGNAFDAAVAAYFAACVAEPVLASLGGGGFLTARRADGEMVVYDFFAQTPLVQRKDDLDFERTVCSFGTATQEFHIGMASIACPGAIRGLFAIHRDLGTVPMAHLAAPALTLAEEGVEVNAYQAEIQQVVAPILLATPASRRLFTRPGSPAEPLAEGDRFTSPEFADFLRALACEGEDLFYLGEGAARLAADCAGGGGHLRRDDLEQYRVERRKPLTGTFRGSTFAVNPAPAVGGMLIAFGLEVLAASEPCGWSFGSVEHLRRLIDTQLLTRQAHCDVTGAERPDESTWPQLVSPESLAVYRETLKDHAASFHGTTQISVCDRHGNLASMTLSNGEGSAYVLPGTGIVLNNMLGETDLNLQGFHVWPCNRRLSSMMSPTVVARADGSLLALGSGGSSRIANAILQTLVNVLALELPLAEAVNNPRLHAEEELIHLEPGFPGAALAALAADGFTTRIWPANNLFFGGVHAVDVGARHRTFHGVGDARRGGVARVVE